MKRVTAILITLLPLLACGQSSNVSSAFKSTFSKAEIMYNQFAYSNALNLYLHVVEKDPSNHTARQRIADCYFRLGEIDKSERWYKELAAAPDSDPKYKYQYAQVLSMQRKYDEAKQWFGAYLTSSSADPRVKEKMEFINSIDYYYRDSVLYEVTNEPYNSDQSDFAPQYFKNDVVFVSARNRDVLVRIQSFAAQNQSESMLSVFRTPKDTDGSQVSLFYKHGLNSPYHDGPVAFSQNWKNVVFSRNNLRAGKPVASSGRVNLELYFARISSENEVTSVTPFSFNNDDWSIAHPWISENGLVLYFASNMPGGEGGVDLYRSAKEGDKWSKPENLGPSINTIGDEFYPHLANDTTLYFSSSGHGGLGGLDNYVVYLTKKGTTAPKNLGYPLNTSYDDFSMIIGATGRNGLFASNRPGGKGYDDIYSFLVRSFFLDGKVIERADSTTHVADARIVLKDKQGSVLDSIRSDRNGRFHFDLDFDKNYVFSATKPGYSFLNKLSYSTHGRTLGHGSLLVPLWRHALHATGFIYSNETQARLDHATVTLENLTDNTRDSIVTNTRDPYRFTVEPNKKYRIVAKKDGFIKQEIHLNTDGLFEGELLNDIVLEEEFVDKVVVQFDFDESEIRSSEISKLEELHRILRRRPHLILHISAFADAQGTHEYNQALSDDRAETVTKYFVAAGIHQSRIVAKGFGETLLLNRCSNGVECPDEEHSKNRRAELKVQRGIAAQ